MFFVHGLLAATLLTVAPAFFAGPAHVGERVTYQVSTTIGAPQATPDVSTLVITWTSGTRLFARLSTALPGAAVAVQRNGDGTLSIASPTPSNPKAASIETLLGLLNFPGLLAARLSGSDHAQTTLSVTPPASTAQPSPEPVIVPLDLSLVSSSASATLIADGNTGQNASHSGRGGSGGGRPGGSTGGSMGGWHSSGSGRSRNGSTANRPSINIAAEAIFDLSGSLEHATYRETIATPSSNGAQTVEHTITIDRVTDH
jgi:uncharacterized membrane protein YgcG